MSDPTQIASATAQTPASASLKDQLNSAFHAHGTDLPQYGWPSEADRWTELLVCLIHQTRSAGAIEEVREAIEIWRRLDLVAPSELAAIQSGSKEELVMLFTLEKLGFTDEQAKEALGAAMKAAQAVNLRYSGKIQRCLRTYATLLRDELIQIFSDTGLPEDKIRYAITHWLQNTTNAPISLEHETVLAFCRDNETDLTALHEAADELNLNLSQLDDLLEARMRQSELIGKIS